MHNNRAALQKFVDRLLVRSALEPDEIEAVLDLPARTVAIDRGRDVVRHGEALDSASLVLEGLVGRYDPLHHGDRQITAFHIAGDMCDLHSVPIPVARWGLEALSPLTIARVPHIGLLALVRAFPNVGLAFWRETAVDGAIFAKWMCNLDRMDARSRLAHLICELGLRMEHGGLGSRSCFGFAATQGQLAEALGMTAVHLNRVLQTLRRDRLVEWKAGRITVSDWPVLAKVAAFDPAYLQDGMVEREPASR